MRGSSGSYRCACSVLPPMLWYAPSVGNEPNKRAAGSLLLEDKIVEWELLLQAATAKATKTCQGLLESFVSLGALFPWWCSN